MLNIFSCACWPCIYLFWKNIYSDPLPVFNQRSFLLLNCMNSLPILDINPLSDISFTNIFSHLLGCLLVLMIGSFTAQLFSLMQVQLFILAFVSLRSTKTLLRLSMRLLPGFRLPPVCNPSALIQPQEEGRTSFNVHKRQERDSQQSLFAASEFFIPQNYRLMMKRYRMSTRLNFLSKDKIC